MDALAKNSNRGRDPRRRTDRRRGFNTRYVEIGAKAAHLRELGMSDKAIARALNVSDKTVAKAIYLTALNE